VILRRQWTCFRCLFGRSANSQMLWFFAFVWLCLHCSGALPLVIFWGADFQMCTVTCKLKWRCLSLPPAPCPSPRSRWINFHCSKSFGRQHQAVWSKHMNLDYDVGDEAGFLVESQDRTQQWTLPGPGWFLLKLQDPVTTPRWKGSLATRVAAATVLALAALNLGRHMLTQASESGLKSAQMSSEWQYQMSPAAQTFPNRGVYFLFFFCFFSSYAAFVCICVFFLLFLFLFVGNWATCLMKGKWMWNERGHITVCPLWQTL
jgi:hypothetical protein